MGQVPPPRECRSARDVDALVAHLYGEVIGGETEGVVHVTAVWEPPGGGPLITLRIGDHTPRSAHDLFVLNLARARADAIVTTAKMLRDEPKTRYDLQGPGEAAEALADWRRSRAGHVKAPWLLILTATGEVPLDHPALHGEARPIILTSAEAALVLEERLRGMHVGIVAAPDPGPRAAIEHAQRELGARLVSIEAGPTTSRALYEEPSAVDELMLSVYRTPSLDERVRGPALLERAALEAILPVHGPARDVEEPSGRWSFQRLRREVSPRGS